MVTPIGDASILYGDDVTEFLNHMLDSPSEIQKRMAEEMKSQRIVYLWDKLDDK